MGVGRLVIGGVRSGEGKTTVALGLMRALTVEGLKVQGFKAGPDYLDTSFQRLATGFPGRNLDFWLQGEDGLLKQLTQGSQTADIALIEGVMGLFDGHRDPTIRSSTAEIAKATQSPVILVVSAAGCAASAAAIAAGFRAFDPEVNLAGVILNHWRPGRDRRAVAAAFHRTGIPVLGWLPPCPSAQLPNRHLGLIHADEAKEAALQAIDIIAEQMRHHVDLPTIRALAATAPTLNIAHRSQPQPSRRVRIAVPHDAAFSFIYQENLEILENLGAEIAMFSPVRGDSLPRNTHGLYLGGGYPEIHAEALSNNTHLREQILQESQRGLPIYAECGGYLYLCKHLVDLRRNSWPMVGLIPQTMHMQERCVHLGYEQAQTISSTPLGPAGTILRGHEFHYARCTDSELIHPALRMVGNGPRHDGYATPNVLASFLHISFLGHINAAQNWLAACAAFADSTCTTNLNTGDAP